MKVVQNIDIALSLNKGKHDLLYETTNEILEHWNVKLDALNSMKKNCCNPDFCGFVKCYTFDEEENDFDFVPVFKEEIVSGDLKPLDFNVRVYMGFVLKIESERDFRRLMLDIDKGDVKGLLTLKDY